MAEDRNTVFGRVRNTGLAMVVAASGAACSVGNNPPPAPVTYEQQQNCITLGAQVAEQASGQVKSDIPGIGTKFVDRLTKNNPDQRPNFGVYADQRGREATQQCLDNAQRENAGAAWKEEQSREAQVRTAEAAAAAAAARESRPQEAAPAASTTTAANPPAEQAPATANAGQAATTPPASASYDPGFVPQTVGPEDFLFGTDVKAKTIARLIMMENAAGDPNAKSRFSSAEGLLMFIDDTATKYNVIQRDPYSNVRGAVAMLVDSKGDLAAKIGREPTEEEALLTHQQGKGTAALINNPAMNAIDAIVPAHNGDRDMATSAIVNNVYAGDLQTMGLIEDAKKASGIEILNAKKALTSAQFLQIQQMMYDRKETQIPRGMEYLNAALQGKDMSVIKGMRESDEARARKVEKALGRPFDAIMDWTKRATSSRESAATTQRHS